MALLLWSAVPLAGQVDSLAPERIEDATQDGLLVGIGWGADPLEPSTYLLDVLLRDADAGPRFKYTTALRYGRYSPDVLVGPDRAARDGFEPDARRDFWSMYMGLQGAMPVLPHRLGIYSRVAVGASMYLGQPFREAGPGGDPATDFQRQVGPRLAPGLEVAAGLMPFRLTGGFRFRTELRLGYEQVPRSGRQRLQPRIIVGGAFPVRIN